jgi:hypothetical protein
MKAIQNDGSRNTFASAPSADSLDRRSHESGLGERGVGGGLAASDAGVPWRELISED